MKTRRKPAPPSEQDIDRAVAAAEKRGWELLRNLKWQFFLRDANGSFIGYGLSLEQVFHLCEVE